MTKGRWEAGPALVLTALVIWDLNDASGPKSVPNASVFLILVAALFGLALAITSRPLRLAPRAPTILVMLCVVAGLAMIPFRPDFVARYVASDIGTLVFFLLAMVVARTFVDALTTERVVVAFVVAYVIIAVLAYIFAAVNIRPAYYWGGRWDPPYFMMLGGLSLFARHAKTLARRLVSTGLLGAMLVLGLTSGNRTQFALGTIFIVLAWASNVLVMWLLTTVAVALAFLQQLGVISVDALTRLFDESRFSLLSGGADDSLMGRFREVNDVWYHVEYLNTPAQTLFGRGAGALWHPITRSLDGVSGDIYYIHIGPAHLGYRFGIFGLALFAYVCWIALSRMRIAVSTERNIGEKFWYLGALGFCLNFLLQNSFNDPPATLAMAVLLAMVAKAGRATRPGPVDASTTTGQAAPLASINWRTNDSSE